MPQIQIGPRTPGRIIGHCMIRHRADTIILAAVFTAWLTILAVAWPWLSG